MSLVVHLRNRYDKQTVLLARVAPDDGRAVVRTALVGAKHLLGERLLEIYHQVFVEFQVTHYNMVEIRVNRLKGVMSVDGQGTVHF